MHQPSTTATIHLSLWPGRVQLLLPTHEAGGRREPRLHLRLLLLGLVRLQLSVRASHMLSGGALTASAVLTLSVLSSAKIAVHQHLRGVLLLRSIGVAHGQHQRRDELLLLSVRALELSVALRGGAHLHHLVEVVVLVHC